MKTSAFLENLHHAYAQTDGGYAFPNSREGDMLKTAKREIELLCAANSDVRRIALERDAMRKIITKITDCYFQHRSDGMLELMRRADRLLSLPNDLDQPTSRERQPATHSTKENL